MRFLGFRRGYDADIESRVLGSLDIKRTVPDRESDSFDPQHFRTALRRKQDVYAGYSKSDTRDAADYSTVSRKLFHQDETGDEDDPD